MVQFITTSYRRMYGNSNVGNPGEKYRNMSKKGLSPAGVHVEKWRKASPYKNESEVVKAANELLPPSEQLDPSDYSKFIHGRKRITTAQIREIAWVLGTTPYKMTHYGPGEVPEDDKRNHGGGAGVIKVQSAQERARRKKAEEARTTNPRPQPKPRAKPQPSNRSKPKPVQVPYDADEAARKLEEKFKGKVRRMK